MATVFIFKALNVTENAAAGKIRNRFHDPRCPVQRALNILAVIRLNNKARLDYIVENESG